MMDREKNRDNEALFENFLDMAGDWALLLDRDGIVQFCHESKLLPPIRRLPDITGRHIADFLCDSETVVLQEALEACEKQDVKQRLSLTGKGGSRFLADIKSRREQGELLGFYVLVTDFAGRLSGAYGKTAVHPSQHNFLEKQITDDLLLRQLRAQELASALSMQLAKAEDMENIDEYIMQSLQLLGEYLDVDRLYVYQNSQQGEQNSDTQIWCSEKAPQLLRQADAASHADFGEMFALLKKKPCVSVTDVALLPEKQQLVLKKWGVKSCVCVPIVSGENIRGMLGMDMCGGKRICLTTEMSLLQTFCGILATAIEKRQMQYEIKEVYTRLDIIVKNYPGIIWYINTDLVITLCEGTVLSAFQMDRKKLLGKHVSELDEIGDFYYRKVKATIESGSQSYIVEAAGRYISCKTNVVKDSRGQMIGQIGIAQDITEQMLMQKQLQRATEEAEKANRAKSEFLSRMSHEIRTPINAIIGMNAIAEKTDDVEKIHYCLEKIDGASKQLMSLINDILDMSKIESGKFEIYENEFDFEKILQNVSNMIGVRVDEKKQNLIIDFDDAFLSNIVCDELRLTQVMVNLLTNAVKFAPDESDITLKIRHWPIDDELCKLHVEVCDQGIGISEEQKKRLFVSFEQADGSTTRKFGGTGLGLAICKKIVELMGGDIWVESEEGRGSRFIFEINFRWGSDLQEGIDVRESDVKKAHVLTVDDHEDVQMYFHNILDSYGVRNSIAGSGELALEMVRQAAEDGDPYNLVFMDWRLPGEDGIKIAKRMKAHNPNEPVIVLISVSDCTEIQEEAMRSGISRILAKPILPIQVFSIVIETMDYLQALQESERHDSRASCWQGKCILIAEDIEINREIIRSILEEQGVSISCAENGKKVVEMYKENPTGYDVILMDIQMPEMDGYQATQAIRTSDLPGCGSIPIIAMTADAFREDVEKCLAVGMNEHIAKPIHMEMMLEKISSFLVNQVPKLR